MSNLLATKLHRPPLPPRRVARPQLVQRLNDGLEAGRQLTLISAPAGFGKTLCACEWLEGQTDPVAWLSLGPADDEPGRFFTYLTAALQGVAPNLGREIDGILRSGALPPPEVISATLVNDISELEGRCLLVLDDFQAIQDADILQVFSTLVTNPPQALHLVLITREDPSLPLGRLRAHNRLTEIRVGDLRFKEAEIGQFLSEVMGLELSENEMAVLEERTEGWIAGLQLAGLSMRGRKDLHDFVRNLRGSQRDILSYLVEEVLSQQNESLQQFLLDTSILDRLNSDLCNEVTGRTDSAGLLEQMYHANLFLIPLDDEQSWYRYHHLFIDLLRHRQSATQGERTAALHRRASIWYERAGQAGGAGARAALIRPAIQHALAAADYASAVRLIEAHAAEILNQWYVKTVQGWLQALPPEWVLQSPKTNLAFAHLHLVRGDFARAAPFLERLEDMFAGSEMMGMDAVFSPAITAEWLALQATLMTAQGRSEQALELARQALELAPEVELQTHSRSYLAQASAYQQLDDPGRAEHAYMRLIQLGQSASNLMIEILGISALALMLIERGRQRNGYELALAGVERVERSGLLPPIVASLYGELGQVSFNWGQIEQAERYFQRAEQASVQGGFSDSAIYYSVARSRICQMRGDLEGARREIQKALQGMRSDSPLVVREQAIAQQVIVFLAEHSLAEAEQTLADAAGPSAGNGAFQDIEPGQKIPYPQGVLYNCALRIHLYYARHKIPAGDPGGGLDFAGGLLDALLHRQFIPLALETFLLRAQLQHVMGDIRSAEADLAAALDLAEPEGYISVFVLEGQPIEEMLKGMLGQSQPESSRARYIHRILDMYADKQGVKQALSSGGPVRDRRPDLYEALTGRELDVLRLMKVGQTYAEIARQLVISINTVRTHVKSIYGKLGVKNRTEALEAAHQMELL